MGKTSPAITRQSDVAGYVTPEAEVQHPSGAFWLHPDRWNEIDDTHKQMFWMRDIHPPKPHWDTVRQQWSRPLPHPTT